MQIRRFRRAAAVTTLAAALVAVGTAPALAAGRWKIVASPNPGKYSTLTAVAALSATDAWAVGSYGSLKSGRTLALHWDGTRWTHVPSPSPGRQTGFDAVAALATDDVWAVGAITKIDMRSTTLIEHWDGSAWSVVPSPSPNKYSVLYGVMGLGTSGKVWAVGLTGASLGARLRGLIEAWDGSRWRVVSRPHPGFDSALYAGTSVSDGDAWAVGTVDGNHNANDRYLAEHWNGTKWTVVPMPGCKVCWESLLFGVAAVSSSDVWAVGYGSSHDAIEHWNGTAWRRVHYESIGDPPTVFAAVAAGSATSAWAVGDYLSGSSILTLTEQWNGTRWSVVSSPNRGAKSFLAGVSMVPGTNEAWAVGDWTKGSGANSTLIELFS